MTHSDFPLMQHFTRQILSDPRLAALAKDNDPIRSVDVIPAARELLLAALASSQSDQRYLLLTDSPALADQQAGRLRTWTRLAFPALDETDTLYHLRQEQLGGFQKIYEGKNRLLVADVSWLVKPVPTAEELRIAAQTFSEQQEIGREAFVQKLARMGYQPVEMVTTPGEFATRGGIVDCYVTGEMTPHRFEFWGEEISSIRAFSPHDQRSLPDSRITQLEILPTQEIGYSGDLRDAIGEYILVGEEELLSTLKLDNRQIRWITHNQAVSAEFDFAPTPASGGRMKQFYENLANSLKREEKVFILTEQAKRLKQGLESDAKRVYGGIFSDLPDNWLSQIEFHPLSRSDYLVGGITSATHGATIYTDYEIFGLVRPKGQSVGQIKAQYRHFLSQIEPGDKIVHEDYGIGVFVGLTHMTATGTEREYLELHYAKGDKVFLPSSQLHKLTKYVGADTQEVALNHLGAPQWKKRRKKAEIDTQAVAQELLEIYARRELARGFAFPQNDELIDAMEQSFPFAETADQLAAIAAVYQDMEARLPMDRLVCGDVGFGKTEVALRAATKAIAGGKQVAYLSPTTILTEQHFLTFSERLGDLGVNVGMVSRFQSAAENKAIVAGLKSGAVDVVIGTHRLLSADVHFKNLGLLIIDEEQRFGVKQKDKLKQLRSGVDVLALSATPIPRTLDLSFAGIRDISLIATPPYGRVPIQTKVTPYDESTMIEALQFELERGGQAFVVYNHLKSIDRFAAEIARELPQARIGVGHGQLTSTALETQMHEFTAGRIDILVASTIIENGVDIPAANTIVIMNAQLFGLSSLHQLRGRVGRADQQAHAWFFYNEEKATPVAVERLNAIAEASDLGAGLSVAMRDLEIRGAGTILGLAQSGHVGEVGYELYAKLLRKAVHRMRQDPLALEIDTLHGECTVELPVSAYFPDEYIGSQAEKMVLYQRLSEIKEASKDEDFWAEIEDRFGRMPPPAKTLRQLNRLRRLGIAAGVERIYLVEDRIKLQIVPGSHPKLSQLLAISSHWEIDSKAYQLRIDGLSEESLWILEKSLEALGERPDRV